MLLTEHATVRAWGRAVLFVASLPEGGADGGGRSSQPRHGRRIGRGRQDRLGGRHDPHDRRQDALRGELYTHDRHQDTLLDELYSWPSSRHASRWVIYTHDRLRGELYSWPSFQGDSVPIFMQNLLHGFQPIGWKKPVPFFCSSGMTLFLLVVCY